MSNVSSPIANEQTARSNSVLRTNDDIPIKSLKTAMMDQSGRKTESAETVEGSGGVMLGADVRVDDEADVKHDGARMLGVDMMAKPLGPIMFQL
jgi:hypothetical protein